jgi:DNA invertase Pin-like site-specific DNA recombinase
MARDRFVAYYRISTDKQGRSGLGLEAQRQAVASYLNGREWQIISSASCRHDAHLGTEHCANPGREQLQHRAIFQCVAAVRSGAKSSFGDAKLMFSSSPNQELLLIR